MKICTKCKIEKDEGFFDKNRGECKECIKEYQKQYYTEHKEDIKEQQKQYRIENKEDIKEQQKHYAINNKEDRKKYQKQYRIENKEDIKENKKQHLKNKYKGDPIFKLRNNVSRAINTTLHKNSSSKNGQSILKHLPYTMEELKQYLKSLFEPWMNWKNHGQYDANTWDENDQSTWKLQIDHIDPHSNFKYTSMEDDNFKICW